jgi:hypothetical protein
MERQMTTPKLGQRHFEALNEHLQNLIVDGHGLEPWFELLEELPAILRAMQERDAHVREVIADLLQYRIGALPTRGDLQDNDRSRAALGRLFDILESQQATPPQAPAVPADWRDDVSLAAQMLTWGRDEGLDDKQIREIDAHAKKLFAMLAASPAPQPAAVPEEWRNLMIAMRDKLIVLIAGFADQADEAEAANLAEQAEFLINANLCDCISPNVVCVKAANCRLAAHLYKSSPDHGERI